MKVPYTVTQRIVSWGRSRDGSGFARGNRSVNTERFCKSQMTLNSGVERSRYAAERRDRLAKLGRLLYPISDASAQLFPRFSLAQEAEIEYNPHFLGGV